MTTLRIEIGWGVGKEVQKGEDICILMASQFNIVQIKTNTQQVTNQLQEAYKYRQR